MRSFIVLVLATFLAGCSPLVVAPQPTPAAPTASLTAAPAVSSAPTAARIPAWWSPGGKRTPGDLDVAAISGPIAQCPAYAELVQVAAAGQAPWVRRSDVPQISQAMVDVLPNAGGPCNPPTATPAPAPPTRPEVAPAPVVANTPAALVPISTTPAAQPTACPPPYALAGCGNLVEVRP